jgi:hypothetical protein
VTVAAAFEVLVTVAEVFALATGLVAAAFVAAVDCACAVGDAMEIAAAAMAPAIKVRIVPFMVLLPRRIPERVDRSPP